MSFLSLQNLNTKRTILREESSSNKKANLNSSPEKWYPIGTDAEGKLKVELTPSAKSAQKVIYIFKNFETGRVLIGMTGQRLSKRVSQYQTKFNEKQPQGDFCEEVKENHQHFKFGILYRLKSDEELTEVEKAYIVFEEFLGKYNKKKGGGCAVIEAPEQPLPTLTSEQLEALKISIPEKSYPLVEEQPGVLRFQLSPNGAAKRGLVYGISDGQDRWMVGKTEQTLTQRMYSYHTLFNKDAAHPLAQEVRANPSQFKLHILKEDLWGAELSFMEKTFIQILDSVKKGYNRNGGGGGGGALIKRRLFAEKIET